MVVSDFPTQEDPQRGVFNIRAVKALASVVDVTVAFLRAWIPGRSLSCESIIDGTQVLTIAAPQLPAVFILGKRLDCVPNAIVYRPVGWRKVRAMTENCDLIHSVGAVSAGVVASAWARRAGKRHVTQIVGSDINVILPGIASLPGIAGWERELDGVACNSHTLKSAFSALYPHIRNVQTIPRGVNLEFFNPCGPMVGPLARRAPVRFLFLGGLSFRNRLPSGLSVKGGETILSAWRVAESELVKVGASLAIAGLGSDCNRILQWRAELHHPQNVHVLGPIPPGEMPSHIRASDVVLVPSLREGLPNVCMEAAACGRPVFGSQTGGIPEVVVDRQTGVLLPAGEPTVWSRALVHYAAETRILQEMGIRGRQRVEELFDAQFYPLKMVELYHAALTLPRERRS